MGAYLIPNITTRLETYPHIKQACAEGWAIRHGWRLYGAGPARFGWWLESAAGALEWLGRTGAAALAHEEAREQAREQMRQYEEDEEYDPVGTACGPDPEPESD